MICLVSAAQKLNNESNPRTSACEKTSAQESSMESYFFCVPKGSVGSLARNRRWQVHVEERAGFRFARLGALPYFPQVLFRGFYCRCLQCCFCLSRDWRVFAVLYIVSYFALAIFPKWLVILWRFFLFPITFSFAFVSTLFFPTRVKKKTVSFVLCILTMPQGYLHL